MWRRASVIRLRGPEAVGLAPAEVAEVMPDAIAWRRHLHLHPELSFREHRTAAFVSDRLAELGSLELSNPTPTSVVATLTGALPGPTLALRADLDALPIQEESGVEFASETDGVMHACRHDGHTAMILATARLLEPEQRLAQFHRGSSSLARIDESLAGGAIQPPPA
jgi:metal-dependent amidase/aminoacylase/carboxypeptidase family protein